MLLFLKQKFVIVLEVSQAEQKDLFTYDSKAKVSQDYNAFIEEYLKMEEQ